MARRLSLFPCFEKSKTPQWIYENVFKTDYISNELRKKFSRERTKTSGVPYCNLHGAAQCSRNIRRPEEKIEQLLN